MMQEGAGVRQLIEDELQRRGDAAARPRRAARARAAGVGDERRARRLRRHVHLALVGRVRLAAGTLAEARVEGLELEREIFLVRAAGRAETRAARAFVEFARERLRDRPLVARRAAAAARRARASSGRSLVASPRWERLVDVRVAGDRWREVPSDRDRASRRAPTRSLAVGGGSAIDTAKAASARAGLPLVSVPTTYSGAEWTPSFGIRTRSGGSSAAAAAHDRRDRLRVGLTLDLPRAETVGTALNALAHCAEALYGDGPRRRGDERALAGAELIAGWLPRVRRGGRRPRGAGRAAARAPAAAGEALGARGPRARPRDGPGARGPLRAAARRDERALPAPGAALQRRRRPGRDGPVRRAIGADDPAAKVEELAGSAASSGSRDFGVPEAGLARSPRRRRRGRATRRTPAPRRWPRSKSCSAPSGSGALGTPAEDGAVER